MDLDEELEVEKSSKRGTFIAFGVVILVAAVAFFLFRRHMKITERDQAQHNAANAWNSLQRCLIGAPLAAGENVTMRIHRVEVNRDPIPAGAAPSDMNDRWPYRCATFATQLRDAAGVLEAGDTTMHNLKVAAERLRANITRGQVETTAIRGHEETAADRLFEAASHVHLPAPANYTGPAAPPVSPMLLRDDLHPLFAGQGSLQVLASDRTPHESLHVAIAQTNVYACEFIRGADAEHTFATARCPTTGATIAGSQVEAQMFDADDNFARFPPIRIGSGRDARVTGLGATPTAEPRAWAFRGSAAADGTITMVDSSGSEYDDAAALGRWHWTQIRATGPRTQGALTLPPESSRPDVLTDRLLYLASSEPGHGPARVGLFSRALTNGANPIGATTDAGTVPEDSRIAGHCRTDHALGVAIAKEHSFVMMMSYGPTWRPPSQPFEFDYDTINCTATDVIVSSIKRSPPTVHQVRCNSSGCTATEERVPGLSTAWTRAGGSPEIADLAGKVLVVWSPEEGGLRMRMAPIGHLSEAHDVVLYDDHGHLGGWVRNPNLYVRGDVAVVVFTDAERDTDQRLMAIRILANGTFQAITPAN